MSGYLSREQILGFNDQQCVDVNVPEWGGVVRLRSLTGAERDKFEAGMFRENKKGERSLNLENLRARLLVLCIVDGDGKQVFTEGDINVLAAKNSAALVRLFTVAQKLNGLAASDVEELVGN